MSLMWAIQSSLKAGSGGHWRWTKHMDTGVCNLHEQGCKVPTFLSSLHLFHSLGSLGASDFLLDFYFLIYKHIHIFILIFLESEMVLSCAVHVIIWIGCHLKSVVFSVRLWALGGQRVCLLCFWISDPSTQWSLMTVCWAKHDSSICPSAAELVTPFCMLNFSPGS